MGIYFGDQLVVKQLLLVVNKLYRWDIYKFIFLKREGEVYSQ